MQEDVLSFEICLEYLGEGNERYSESALFCFAYFPILCVEFVFCV